MAQYLCGVKNTILAMKQFITLGTALLVFALGVNAQTPQNKSTKTTAQPNKSSTTTKTTTPAKTTDNSGKSTGQVKSAPATTTNNQAKKAEDKPAETAPTGAHAFAKGDNIFNIGVGFGHFYGIFSGIVGFPSVNLSYENVFYSFAGGKGAIGLGGTLGWWHGRYTNNYWLGYYDDYKASYNRYAVGVRCVVHYDLFDVPKLDTYAGLNVGAYLGTSRVRYTDPIDPAYNYDSRSASAYGMYGFFVGARYYTGKNNKFGFFGELGYGLSVLRLGIALRATK